MFVCYDRQFKPSIYSYFYLPLRRFISLGNHRTLLPSVVTGVLPCRHHRPRGSSFLADLRQPDLRADTKAQRLALALKRVVESPTMRAAVDEGQKIQPPAVAQPAGTKLQRLDGPVALDQFQSHIPLPFRASASLVDE